MLDAVVKDGLVSVSREHPDERFTLNHSAVEVRIVVAGRD
jgi:hypothetical protein